MRKRRIAILVAVAATLVSSRMALPAGIDRGHPEPHGSPCEDFYEYANGAWLDTVQIRGAFPFASRALGVYLRNQTVLVQVLEQAASESPRREPALRKLGILYGTLTDSARAQREGIGPLRGLLQQIDATGSTRDLVVLFVKCQSAGCSVPLELVADADPTNSRMTIGFVRQGGLGLPDRDIYFRRGPEADSLRQAYRAHVTALLELMGRPHGRASAAAGRVVALETALADSALSVTARRERQTMEPKFSARDLDRLAPQFDWTAYWMTAGVRFTGSLDSVVVEDSTYVRQLGHLLNAVPLDVWRDYLRARVLETAGIWLSDDIRNEVAAYRARLSGQLGIAPRRQDALQAANEVMGDALGKAFVARAFSRAAKRRACQLVDELQAAFDARLARLSWMSADTRRMAREKLSRMTKKIGYPDRWRTYSGLTVSSSWSGWANLRSAREFEQRREWSKIGKPVDRRAWQMSPATLNAYYSWSNNEIVFPAAFLQPPQFDLNADAAALYGGAGAIIGHEMTHGFDDQGRHFDADGNLSNWWRPQDERRFNEHAQRFIEEYNAFVAIDTLHLNGRLTLGENMADLGGLEIAYNAYERFLAEHGRRQIGGLTPEQRFFMAFAHTRASVYRPELMRMVVLTDTHAPDRWRVNGSVSNMPEFQVAFGCGTPDRMSRSDSLRATLW